MDAGILEKFVDHGSTFLVRMLVIGSVFAVLEYFRPADKGTKIFARDAKKEWGVALMNGIILIPIFAYVMTAGITGILSRIVPHQAFDSVLSALPLALQAISGALIMDFSTYWRHRFTHKYMWPYHAFHHSAEEITWITSFRLHPIEVLVAIIFDTSVLYVLGFSGDGIAFSMIFMMLYNYFTHTNLDFSFEKPLCYILASPRFHRWHHATDKEAHNKNFCGAFSCLDLIFGTYYFPDNRTPAGYGLTPVEQAKVPRALLPHLLLPLRAHLRRIMRRR